MMTTKKSRDFPMICEHVNTSADGPQTPAGQQVQPRWTHHQRDELIWRAQISHKQKFLLAALAHFADGHGRCWPSEATLARACGVDARTVRSWVATCVADGLITRTPRPGRSPITTIEFGVLATRAGDPIRDIDVTPTAPDQEVTAPSGGDVVRMDRWKRGKKHRPKPPPTGGDRFAPPPTKRSPRTDQEQSPPSGGDCAPPPARAAAVPDPTPAPLPLTDDLDAYTRAVYARMGGGAS